MRDSKIGPRMGIGDGVCHILRPIWPRRRLDEGGHDLFSRTPTRIWRNFVSFVLGTSADRLFAIARAVRGLAGASRGPWRG